MSIDEQRETAIDRNVVSGELQPVKVAPPSDPDVLRREIRETRDDLAEALASLARKADVKTQVSNQLGVAKAKLADTRLRATEQIKTRKTVAGAGAAGLVALIAGGVVAIIAVRRKRAASPAPMGRLRERAREATSRAYEAQERLFEAERKAVQAARDRAWKARAKDRDQALKARSERPSPRTAKRWT